MSGSDGKKVLWEVVYDHVIEGVNKHNEIGLRGLIIQTSSTNSKREMVMAVHI